MPLLINTVLVILAGAANQTHLCKYSRGVAKKNKRTFKELRVGLAAIQAEGEGAQRSLSECPAVVFQCQIVPRACCYSTPSFSIWSTTSISPSDQRMSVNSQQSTVISLKCFRFWKQSLCVMWEPLEALGVFSRPRIMRNFLSLEFYKSSTSLGPPNYQTE